MEQIRQAVGVLPSIIWVAPDLVDLDIPTADYILTAEQVSKVDAIMGRPDPKEPPEAVEVVKITDIWERRHEFMDAIGIPFVIYFNYTDKYRPDFGDNGHDVLELHFSRKLTPEEKERLKAAYADLMHVT
jgi:hypothetical protein